MSTSYFTTVTFDCLKYMQYNLLRWHAHYLVEVNENINLGYSPDQGFS